MKASKTVVHNANMKYQNEGIFKNRKRSAYQGFFSSKEDRLFCKIVVRSPVSSSKNSGLVDGNWPNSQYQNLKNAVSGIWSQIVQASQKIILDSGNEKETSRFPQKICYLGHREIEKRYRNLF